MPGQQQTFVLKHRLTGAAILIGFAVVVLPMLLDGSGGSQRDQLDGDSIGQPDTKVFRSNITPIGGSTPTVQERRVAEQLADSRPASPPASSDDATSKPTQSDDSGESAAPQDKEVKGRPTGDDGVLVAARDEKNPKRALTRGWIVQVGTFSKPENVKNIVETLKKSGFESSIKEVETSTGPATRVWVGPYETRVEAARIRTRVKQKTGAEGLIVAFP